MRLLLCLFVLGGLLWGCGDDTALPRPDQPRRLPDRFIWPDLGEWDLPQPPTDGSGPLADRPRVDRPSAPPDSAVPDLPAGPCASGEHHFAGHCYRVTGVKFIGYQTGQLLCSNQSPPMKVVTISSAAENQFVYGLLPPLNQVAWIGLKRTGSGVTDFAWTSGEPAVFWNWASGEPNNENGNEQCVVMWGPNLSFPALRSFWNDMPCDYAKVDAVICERVP